MDDLRRQWASQVPPAALFDEEPKDDRTYLNQSALVCKHGWPDGDPALGAWLDGVFEDAMWQRLAKLPGLPVGVVDDPRTLTYHSRLSTDSANLAGTLLAARGLQMQKARGKPAAFVENLEVALALARNLEKWGPTYSVPAGLEHDQLLAVQRWLENLGDAALLRRALAALRLHRDALPSSRLPQKFADYRIALNSIDRPGEWLYIELGRGSQSELESALLETAWQTPWERARLQRLVRYLHWTERPEVLTPFRAMYPAPAEWDRTKIDPARPMRLDATILLVALRLYQAEKSGLPKSLDALVPAYLPEQPRDPFGQGPFRYRVSKGEKIAWPDPQRQPQAGGEAPGDPMPEEQEPARAVLAGQGVVWSVGQDGSDDGGVRNASSWRSAVGEDIVFIVPMPAKKK
jgi:hypothetical protein